MTKDATDRIIVEHDVRFPVPENTPPRKGYSETPKSIIGSALSGRNGRSMGIYKLNSNDTLGFIDHSVSGKEYDTAGLFEQINDLYYSEIAQSREVKDGEVDSLLQILAHEETVKLFKKYDETSRVVRYLVSKNHLTGDYVMDTVDRLANVAMIDERVFQNGSRSDVIKPIILKNFMEAYINEFAKYMGDAK